MSKIRHSAQTATNLQTSVYAILDGYQKAGLAKASLSNRDTTNLSRDTQRSLQWLHQISGLERTMRDALGAMQNLQMLFPEVYISAIKETSAVFKDSATSEAAAILLMSSPSDDGIDVMERRGPSASARLFPLTLMDTLNAPRDIKLVSSLLTSHNGRCPCCGEKLKNDKRIRSCTLLLDGKAVLYEHKMLVHLMSLSVADKERHTSLACAIDPDAFACLCMDTKKAATPMRDLLPLNKKEGY
jgi:hypothetical protein